LSNRNEEPLFAYNVETKGHGNDYNHACSENQSETWLLERTYHARLRNGEELSVPDLTRAMKQITSFYVPLSTWQEISQAEAHAANQHGIPVLLYGESLWEQVHFVFSVARDLMVTLSSSCLLYSC
jgi:hypothetical protein